MGIILPTKKVYSRIREASQLSSRLPQWIDDLNIEEVGKK